jgi:HEAT repeat protein
MKTMKKLIAVALTIGAATTTAYAGRGGGEDRIVAAVSSGSQDAILAEVERAEGLICMECVATVQQLTADDRYPVRQVAAWWFAKRPGLQRQLAVKFEADLSSGNSILVRNAADFLGTTKEYKALPLLRTTMLIPGLSSDARLALVRAAGYMAHVSGNPILVAGMSDADPSIRAAAVAAWRDVLHQTGSAPVEPLLGDTDAHVRSVAATVLGAYKDGNAMGPLQQLVMSDPDTTVRRNAAWALGQIGSSVSREALTKASQDASPIVASVAKSALASLR